MLDKLVPMQLPYPIRGAIIRGIRTFIAIVLAGLAASIADGSIIEQISIIPEAYKPVVLLGLSTTFVAIDKYLREKDLVGDEDDNIPLSENSDDVDPENPADLPDSV